MGGGGGEGVSIRHRASNRTNTVYILQFLSVRNVSHNKIKSKFMPSLSKFANSYLSLFILSGMLRICM